MEYLVCYDIADDKRRAGVGTTLLNFGRRVQESVFLATLDSELFGRLRERLGPLLAVEEDSLLIIPLCAECRGKVERMGRQDLPVDKNFYVV